MFTKVKIQRISEYKNFVPNVKNSVPNVKNFVSKYKKCFPQFVKGSDLLHKTSSGDHDITKNITDGMGMVK